MSLPIPRQHQRVSLADAGLRCVILPSDATMPGAEGILTVISPGGAFIETTQSPAVGSWVGLRFTLPDTSDEIICGGTVRNHVEGHGFGMQFSFLSSVDHRRLEAVVGSHSNAQAY